MTTKQNRDEQSHDDPIDSLTDPETLRGRADVPFSQRTSEHEGEDHCSIDVAGRVAVGVTDGNGRRLLLCNDELGIAILPHGTVEAGENWAAVARRGAEGQTGITIDLDEIVAVRAVDHVVDGADEPHCSTHRVVFAGSTDGDEIRDCKRSVDAGSDSWRAGWFDGLPESLTAPGGGPGDDLELFLE